MIRFLKQALAKARRIPADKARILFLLTAGVFLKTMAATFWDIGAAALLIEKDRIFALGMDLILAGLVTGCIGFRLWRLDRQKGRGAVGLSAGCVLVMSIALMLYAVTAEAWGADILFLMKYPLLLILTTVYWAVVRRFVSIRFDSLKFLGLFCCELVAFGTAGLMSVLISISPMGLMIAALFLTIGLALVLKTIFDLAPLSAEVFVRKTDGIQDVFERPLLWDILILFFLGGTTRVLSEVVLYLKLVQTGIQPVTVLGLIWFLFGGMGCVMVLALYRTRYIYTTLSGMMIFGISIILTGLVALGQHSGPVASGFLMMLLLAHFYLAGYLQILPRVLSNGIGTRLKKRVLTGVLPLGFIFCGSLVLNVEPQILSFVLAGMGCVLIFVTIRSAVLYAQVVRRMMETRFWCRGPIMLPFPKMVSGLINLLKSRRADEVIYALRMLKIANHPAYESALVMVLKHPKKEVRLYALTRMRRLYNMGDYLSEYRKLFQKDPQNSVRNQALSNLILSETSPKKYEKYLNDRFLKAGAIGGFLARIGSKNEAVITALEQLARSKMPRDNMAALALMAAYPDKRWTVEVERFLKKPNLALVRQGLLAAGALKDPQLLPRIFRAMDDVRLQEYALKAIQMYGKAAFPPIERLITREQTPMTQRKQLILFLGVLNSGEGKQILLRSLNIENQKLRKTIVQNILDSGIIWIQSDKRDILKACLKKDIDRISWLIRVRENLMNAPTHESEEAIGFFLRAIQEDIDDTRELILYQMLLLENNPLFGRAVRVLLGDSYELYLPAMGVIQDLLPNKLYRKIKSVLLLPLAQKHKATLSGLTPEQVVGQLSDVILNPPIILNHWVRATALYALRRLGLASGIRAAEAALNDPHPIVLEAAIWTLVRLQPDKDALHQQLLTIPTSRLSSLSLDRLLDS